MELNRNALDPHHLQRTHHNENSFAFRSDFRYATLGRFDVLPVSLLPNYTQYKIRVKHKVLALT